MKEEFNKNKTADINLVNSPIEQKILESAAKLHVPHHLSNEEAWDILQQKIQTEKPFQKKVMGKKRTITLVLSAAATILLLFGIWQLFFQFSSKEIIAPRGQHAEYQLPDGTRVSLNAESKISFSKNHFAKKRSLDMDGEVFFIVKKGSTFTIQTKLANIRILGTSFNVFARENSFKVSCVTGKIEVSAGNQTVTIVPGENAAINNGILIKDTEKNNQRIASWRNGEFTFDNIELVNVFEELERQFNVTFVLPQMDKKYYSGGFNNTKLLDALENVCGPMGLTYEIGRNSQIYIYEQK